jgi:hypothetical protein
MTMSAVSCRDHISDWVTNNEVHLINTRCQRDILNYTLDLSPDFSSNVKEVKYYLIVNS